MSTWRAYIQVCVAECGLVATMSRPGWLPDACRECGDGQSHYTEVTLLYECTHSWGVKMPGHAVCEEVQPTKACMHAIGEHVVSQITLGAPE